MSCSLTGFNRHRFVRVLSVCFWCLTLRPFTPDYGYPLESDCDPPEACISVKISTRTYLTDTYRRWVVELQCAGIARKGEVTNANVFMRRTYLQGLSTPDSLHRSRRP